MLKKPKSQKSINMQSCIMHYVQNMKKKWFYLNENKSNRGQI